MTDAPGAPVLRKPSAPAERRYYRASYEVGHDVYDAINQIAKAEMMSASDVVRFALRQFIQDYQADGPWTQEMRQRKQPKITRLTIT